MIATSTPDTDKQAYEALRFSLERLGRVVVAFSGGADSSLLAYVATTVLGQDRVLCATAISPSLASEEHEDCSKLAGKWEMRHVFVETHELQRAAYIKNDLNRCYFCKDELMGVLDSLAKDEMAIVVLGVNIDDLGEHRPGQQAAQSRGAVFPLVEAGLTKDRVRSLSKSLGLSTWDKPAAACLASRVPHGTPVTVDVLNKVGRAESALKRLGFSNLRVRHYDRCARIEVPADDFPIVLAERAAIVASIHEAGYEYVTLDLEGLRSGNLSNDALRQRAEKKGTS